jgi:ATP-binding cassette, subfamily B, bacterial MsbA
LKYLMVYKGRILLAVVAGFLMAQCNVFTTGLAAWFAALNSSEPISHTPVVKYAVKYGLLNIHQCRGMAAMIIIASMLVLITIPKGILTYINAYLVASVTNRVGTDVRSEMYAHVQKLPLRFFHRSKTGHLMSLMSYDVGLIQNSSLIITQAIDGPAMIISGLAWMFVVSWQLAMMIIVISPLMGFAIDRLSKRIRSLTTTQQIKLADVSATIEETVRGVRIIKSFGMEEQEVKRFNRVNTNSLIAALRAARRSSLVVPSIDIMGSVAVAVIVFAGGGMVARGAIGFPTLVMFGMLAFYVSGAVKQFGRLNVTYQQTLAGAMRIFDLLDTKSDMFDDPDGVVLNDVRGQVELRDVCFEYDRDEQVLDHVSFAISPGEVVAIVGPSGAGKSTIADLIPRFYDVTGGEVLVEGHDVRNIKLASLRDQIAMVPQETILFSGTIGENIAYGRPGADQEEIIEAARAANAHDFITQCPNGYDTVLGEAGVGLSGGQRQRISIARALLKNPRILILDEATSSLDAASEGVVQEALDRLMKGRSTLVIAHRLSTVKNADRILVMDQGRVTESGSFDRLVKSDGMFAQLYKTQFRSQEASDVRAEPD